jgi:hypothetical protein
VDARRGGCDDAPAIVPLHGVGHGAEAKLAGDGSAPCLSVDLDRFYRTKLKSRGRPAHRIARVGPQVPPAPSASLRAKGAPLRGRVPPMDYPDNPERCRTGRPSDGTSANSCGFRPASTVGQDIHKKPSDGGLILHDNYANHRLPLRLTMRLEHHERWLCR